ncbi:hypothetical protein PspLS_01545 [Pyricularia sp. CBS 133598]|nr:hypothetical protein PspLS_01545 [Pyricularia sp. CBS 133598]
MRILELVVAALLLPVLDLAAAAPTAVPRMTYSTQQPPPFCYQPAAPKQKVHADGLVPCSEPQSHPRVQSASVSSSVRGGGVLTEKQCVCKKTCAKDYAIHPKKCWKCMIVFATVLLPWSPGKGCDA